MSKGKRPIVRAIFRPPGLDRAAPGFEAHPLAQLTLDQLVIARSWQIAERIPNAQSFGRAEWPSITTSGVS